jgi:hypothetical protein
MIKDLRGKAKHMQVELYSAKVALFGGSGTLYVSQGTSGEIAPVCTIQFTQ